MSTVRAKDRVVAILCSDIHLSLKAPLARAEEPDWFAAMRRPLDELGELADEHDAPILCAGDVFDYWRSPPELVNFAIEDLPEMYAIPGQHDLPYHSLEEIEKSAFWSLVLAGRIHVVDRLPLGIDPTKGHSLALWGFPFGVPVQPPGDAIVGHPAIALIHEYLWMPGSSYTGAPDEAKVSRCVSKFKGYDVVVVGDNHKGFLTEVKHKDGTKTVVFNCGGLMRRKADEIDYRPQVGLLHASGEVEIHYLNTDSDKITKVDAVIEASANMDLSGLFGELNDLSGAVPDFVDTINHALDESKASLGVRRAVQEAMEHDKDA